MSATTAYMPPHSALSSSSPQNIGSSGGSGSFSPLTMFECTISSATMLVDSMTVRDLLVAFKVVAQLHGHLLEVLDPTVQRLATVADAHAMCSAAATASTSSVTATDSPVIFSSTFGSNNGNNNKRNTQQQASSSCPNECLVIEDEFPPHHQQQQPQQQHQHQSQSLCLTTSGSELSNEWKATLRKAYRLLKEETGTNVFDFSLPYSAGANVRAAQKVIDRSLGLCRQRPHNMTAWQSLAGAYVHRWFRCNLKPTAKRAESQQKISATFSKMRSINSKLNRRRRAYEALKHQLDEATRAKAESVALSRDYTSSDEECGGGDGAPGDCPAPPRLRVRALPWESDELWRLKRRLDEAAATAAGELAEQQQPEELPPAVREPGIFSTRPPPHDGEDWAKTTRDQTTQVLQLLHQQHQQQQLLVTPSSSAAAAAAAAASADAVADVGFDCLSSTPPP